MCLRIIRQIFRLTAADLRRFVRSPKAVLILVFSIFFAWDFVKLVVPYAEGQNVAVTPFVYPFFLNEWSGCLYTLLLICVLMSDAPFQNGSELFLRLRVSKYVWLAGKTLYILAVSFLYQVILAILCVLVFVPETGVGFSTSWGYVLRSYYIGSGGAVDMNGNATTGSLLSYAPVTAMLLQILLAALVSAMLGMLMLLLNALFRNYTGTVLVSVVSCAHLLLGSLGIYGAISFDSMVVPTSWINLGNLAEEMSPYLAAGILAGIMAVLALAGAVLLRFRRIEVWE
ncbi:MAG: hypothetical protein LUE29_08405 [Lachnospiraceae bacterium]|nr:hypothetical protein [Lachnospiraceae bacterium]